MKKENEYFFNVRLNLKKADHRKAYNRLMNRHSQSISDCVVDALCFMDEGASVRAASGGSPKGIEGFLSGLETA